MINRTDVCAHEGSEDANGFGSNGDRAVHVLQDKAVARGNPKKCDICPSEWRRPRHLM